ncbi:putative membrane protein [Nocardioides zeae]|uniref:Membrane protein n=1 Tax=Nocardioides zeae TaxID=1457234 RepID=A0ACC6IC91_9ACTN|nr:PH domain-containing protein [Nocardioides zeae]MDR6175391.1 putative membrane protein [Nocardioides zeae]MDR6208324.1 putative membrane protein [Nocardioides zeae]
MSDPSTAEGWQRLDRRLLLISPLQVLRGFAVPIVFSLVGIGTQAGAWTLLLIPVSLVAAAVFGALPWLTTSYRRTPAQLELRTGWLHRKRLTAPLDRVRSVDLTSSLLHRVLGVTKVEIGTGVDDERITLEAVDVAEAQRLQRELLDRARPGTTGAGPGTAGVGPDVVPGGPEAPGPAPAGDEEQLAALSWSWLRFAPLNVAQMAIVLGACAGASQFVDDLPFADVDHAQSAYAWLTSQVLVLVVLVALGIAAVLWLVVALVGYVLTWSGFRLVRLRPAGRPEETSIQLRAGLLTTRSTTVEERRVRGVRLTEQALMRVAGGGELATLATGVEEGTTTVVPPCPAPVAVAVGHEVLGARETAPLQVPLAAHGGAARRRAHVRWQRLPVLLTLVAVGLTLGFDGPWWPVVLVAVVLGGFGLVGAEQSYRHLGHALTHRPDGTPWHVVMGSGGYDRVRTVLETEGVIGWVVRQSFFQRRLGLATLVATTAAGPESVELRDVPLSEALRLADAATPGLLTPFRAA